MVSALRCPNWLEIARMLVSRNVDVNLKLFGIPLFVPVEHIAKNYKEVAQYQWKYLLSLVYCKRFDFNAQPNIDIEVRNPTLNDFSLLHLCDSVEILEIIFKKGINADLQDASGNTALHIAAQRLVYAKCHLKPSSNEEKIKLLIQNGANVNFRNKKGQTPLHVCSAPGVVDILVELGANIEEKDKVNFLG